MESTKKSKHRVAPHMCDTCGEIYYNKGHLVQHKKSHVEQKIFPCTECNKKYSTKHLLKRHLATHSGGVMYDRKYTCEHCGSTFISSSHLVVHLRTHTGEKPFACQKCKKAFIDKSTLQRHVKTVHEKQKPYVCDKCGKSFTQSCHLKGHILTHSLEKPYVCTKCPKRYSDQQMLRRHIKLHEIDPDNKKITGRKTELVKDLSTEHSVPATCSSSNVVKQVGVVSKICDSELINSGTQLTGLDCIQSPPFVVTLSPICNKVNLNKMKPKLSTSETLPCIETLDQLNQEPCSSCFQPKKNTQEFETGFIENSVETIDKLVTQIQNDSLTDLVYQSMSDGMEANCENIQLNNITEDTTETDEIGDNSLTSESDEFSKTTDEIKETIHYERPSFLSSKENPCDKQQTDKEDISKINIHLRSNYIGEPLNVITTVNNETNERFGSVFETSECNISDKHYINKVKAKKITESDNPAVDNLDDSHEMDVKSLLHEQSGHLQLVNDDTTDSNPNYFVTIQQDMYEKQKPNQDSSMKEIISPSEQLETEEVLETSKEFINNFDSNCCNFSDRIYDKDILRCTTSKKKKTVLENKKHNTISAISKERNKKVIMCNICGKTLSSIGNLTIHIRIHTGEKPYSCDVCHKNFVDKSTLNRHINIHTRHKKYVCEECGKSFTQSSHLRSHQSVHTTEKDFKCTVCEKGFANKRYLTLHLRQHTNSKAKPTCNKCGKSFTSLRSLKSHDVIHGGPNKYNCEHCFKPFLYKFQLQRHLQSHSDDKPFECVQCNKKYKAERYLKLHMMSHTGERPFVCDICGKAFTQERNLKSHQLRHFDRNSDISNDLKEQFKKQDERALKKRCVCNVCGKLCRDTAVLALHTRKHTGEKPYKCTECAKGFASGYRLKVHKLSHANRKPFVCSYCNKGFVQRWNLKTHMSVHQTETPFQCKSCNKFLNSHALEGHLRTHSEEKPFECPLCLEKFSQRTNWSAQKSKHLAEGVTQDASVSP